MSAKQGYGGNKVTAKTVAVWGMLCCLCLIFSFLESLIPLDFIAPGIKLGLANGVALLLILRDDIKGAFFVNMGRILLSVLLFSSPFTLIYSLSAGIVSLIVSALCSKSKNLSGVGISIISAFTHNITQTVVAAFFMGAGVFYYLPLLLISALASGSVIGIISNIIFKKMKTNGKF